MATPNKNAATTAIHNGLLVAGAGERSVCEALGAVAPLLSSTSFNGRLPRALEGQDHGADVPGFAGKRIVALVDHSRFVDDHPMRDEVARVEDHGLPVVEPVERQAENRDACVCGDEETRLVVDLELPGALETLLAEERPAERAQALPPAR